MTKSKTILKLEGDLKQEIIEAMLRFCDGCDEAKISGRLTAAYALDVLLTRAYETARIGGADHETIMRVFDQWFDSRKNEAANRKEEARASNLN